MVLTPLHPSYSGRAKVKPLNFSQGTVVQQGPAENPLTFLQHLKDIIRKHTTVDPESQEGEVLLKDKFLTQSAPDIHENSKSLWLKEKNHWTNKCS
jgi:hypothetical protein